MTKFQTRLILVTPILTDADAMPPLEAVLKGSDVASIILRLAPADDRTLVNRIKSIVPIAHRQEAALLVTDPGVSDIAAVATRGGADGVHAVGLEAVRSLVERGRGSMVVGAGGLGTRHDAMSAGELEADYLLFGDAAPDGSSLSLDLVVERAAWWAEIFETPCIALARSVQEIGPLARTGAEFIALDGPVWTDDPHAALSAAGQALSPSSRVPA
jgi:thiamine-phosphate pyrophosphorylase